MGSFAAMDAVGRQTFFSGSGGFCRSPGKEFITRLGCPRGFGRPAGTKFITRLRLQAEALNVLSCVVTERTTKRRGPKAVRKRNSQGLLTTPPAGRSERKNAAPRDEKTEVSSLADLILAIQHKADVRSSLDPWIQKLSLQQWNKVVNNVGNKHWTHAMEVFQVLKETSQFLKPGVERYELNLLEAYTCIAGVLGKQGRVEEAEVLEEELRAASVKADTYFYNALLGAYATRGLAVKVSEVVLEMDRLGIQRDYVTHERVLVAHLNAEEPQLHSALKVLREMNEKGLQVSARTFTQLIDACCNNGDTGSAADVFVAMRTASHVPHTKIWSKLMQLYGSKGDYARAEELMGMLIADGIPATSNLYDSFLLAYAVAGARDQAFSVFREYKGVTKPTLMAYNVLIDLCGKCDLASESMKLFSEASDSNLRPNTVTYTSMINALTRIGMYQELDDIVEKMAKNNVSPNILTYTSLIHAHTARGWTKKGHAVYGELKKSGCAVTVTCYGALLSMYVSGGWYSSAAEILTEMESKGMEPDFAGYAALSAAYGDVGSEVAPLARAMKGSNLEFCRLLHQLLVVPHNSVDTEAHVADADNCWNQALSLLEKWVARRTAEENCSLLNAITDVLWKQGLTAKAKMVVLRARSLFHWYKLPSFTETKWLLDVRCLSTGAAHVAILDWLEEACSQAANRASAGKMVIITGRSGAEADEEVSDNSKHGKATSKQLPLSKRAAIACTLKEVASPFVANPYGDLEAKTSHVIDWWSGSTKIFGNRD